MYVCVYVLRITLLTWCVCVLQCVGPAQQYRELMAEVLFMNPLDEALTDCTITVTASGVLHSSVEARSEVPPLSHTNSHPHSYTHRHTQASGGSTPAKNRKNSSTQIRSMQLRPPEVHRSEDELQQGLSVCLSPQAGLLAPRSSCPRTGAHDSVQVGAEEAGGELQLQLLQEHQG